MNAQQFRRKLKLLGACDEGLVWCKGKTLAEFWETCERADWMLWLCAKMLGEDGWPDRKKLVLLACLCAETSLNFVPEGEDRPRKAIETARAWCKGKATIAEVRKAGIAASCAAAASAASASADSAAYASYAAAYASYADSAAYASYAAAYASYAAAYASYAALRKMARMIRTEFPVVGE